MARDDMLNLINPFKCCDLDQHALQALQSSGEYYHQARETLKGVSVDASGKVELEDWVEVRSWYHLISAPLLILAILAQRQAKNIVQSIRIRIACQAGNVTVKGSNANVGHTIDEDERNESTNHINGNNNITTSAKGIGCSVVDINSSDISEGREHLIFGLIWQIIRRSSTESRYLTPSSLVAGTPRLNLAFVANLFNTWPGLAPLHEQEAKDYGALEDFDAQREREARVLTLLLNSLGVEPGVFNLFENLKGGLIIRSTRSSLAHSLGDASPSPMGTPRQSLDGGKTSGSRRIRVELGMQNGIHLVGIQGADIVDGTRTLVLGLVWSLMRLNITKTLMGLSGFGLGRPITDQEMLKWANSTVQKTKPTTCAIRSFKDPSLTTSIFCVKS
ncbi:Ca2+-binding actin-bundling protein [Tylopilus felleus]